MNRNGSTDKLSNTAESTNEVSNNPSASELKVSGSPDFSTFGRKRIPKNPKNPDNNILLDEYDKTKNPFYAS